MSVLTPQTVLRHLRDRLLINYVDPVLYQDTDILTMMNDAYLDACEQTMILQTLATIPLVTDQQEYDLPDGYSQMITVVAGGTQLDPIALSEGLTEVGYYTYGTKIGVSPPPIDAANLMLLYAAEPEPFATFDDGFDARFPVEYADLLLHWVRWRTQMLSGGAERIRAATIDRAIYDTRIKEMRRAVSALPRQGPALLSHIATRPRTSLAR